MGSTGFIKSEKVLDALQLLIYNEINAVGGFSYVSSSARRRGTDFPSTDYVYVCVHDGALEAIGMGSCGRQRPVSILIEINCAEGVKGRELKFNVESLFSNRVTEYNVVVTSVDSLTVETATGVRYAINIELNYTF